MFASSKTNHLTNITKLSIQVVKLKTKAKLVFFLALVGAGAYGYFKVKPIILKYLPGHKQVKAVKQEEVKADNSKFSGAIRDLEKCQRELFLIRNENAKLQIMPDARKDVISLLLIMRKIEGQIGQKRDFSDECVRLFSNASRVPATQEFALKYKEPMFEKICQVPTEEDILITLHRFERKLADIQHDKKMKDATWYKQAWELVKYNTSKIFKSTVAPRSELEKYVLNHKYDIALNQLETHAAQELAEYNKLHAELNELHSFRQMIDGLYEIIERIGQE